MAYELDDLVVIAVSSRALFDFDEANCVFDEEGTAKYRQFQLDHLKEAAEPGVAFPLVQKLLRFNTAEKRRVEVVVLSRNDPVSGLRVFHSAREHALDVTRGAFTQGQPPFPYLAPFKAVLFLSASEEDVKGALGCNCPAAVVYANPSLTGNNHPNELRIAFDGDGVLFDDSSERVYQEQGLNGFHAHETANAAVPLPPGPFRPFVAALRQLQQEVAEMSVRTMLITARNAPAHERAVLTLREWRIEVDEALFLGGVAKSGFLAVFHPDFFFDDQRVYTDAACDFTPTGHVPCGIIEKMRSTSEAGGA